MADLVFREIRPFALFLLNLHELHCFLSQEIRVILVDVPIGTNSTDLLSVSYFESLILISFF